MKHIVCWSGGKDSTATIILAHLNRIRIDLIIYCEVMFDEEISGEHPEQAEFIRRCIPVFEGWGYPVKVVRSEKTYMSEFNRIVIKGKHKGQRIGFPQGGMCHINRDLKTKPITRFLKTLREDFIQFMGIAADEPIRLDRVHAKKNQISLLEQYGMTEKDARDLCIEYNLYSPMYSFTNRGGCWFCPNAKKDELYHLFINHNSLFTKLAQMESETDIAGYIFDIRKGRKLQDMEKEFTARRDMEQ